MRLEELKKRVQAFDKKAGWDKTELDKLIAFMQEELDNLKENRENRERINHVLTDLLMLIMQAGYKQKTDFGIEIEKWFKEAQKSAK